MLVSLKADNALDTLLFLFLNRDMSAPEQAALDSDIFCQFLSPAVPQREKPQDLFALAFLEADQLNFAGSHLNPLN